MNPPGRHHLWVRWVVANELGEIFGLGLTFAAGVIVMAGVGGEETLKTVFLSSQNPVV